MSDQPHDDGGPAFPVSLPVTRDGKEIYGCTNHGMSMRDHFASQALIGLISTLEYEDRKILGKDGPVVAQLRIANGAYAIADAMLKAREKK